MAQGSSSNNTLHVRLARPLLVTFSGLDGAGKTTQIENLHRVALDLGLRTRVIAFWDDIVVGTGFREGFVHTVYKSQKGVGEPGRPVERRDKNVQAWYLTLARHMLYTLDGLHARRVVRRALRDIDVLIVDRYFYDECASLPASSAFSRVFIHALSELVPKPDLAFILDADPVAARQRKPEYPVDFMQQYRAKYLRIADDLHGVTVIPPLPLAEAKAAVESVFIALVRSASDSERRQRTAA